MNTKALEAANAAMREKRERGEKIERLNPVEKARRDPKSRPKALRAYYWDLNLVEQNKGLDGVSARDLAGDARAQRAAILAEHGNSHVRAIKGICQNCVGGNADAGMRISIRDCQVGECPLHPVRPYQAARGRPPSVR